MLFLLRQIRRQLLEKNKFTTYLLYGVGEIVLVVIGILIAVQIDDWNKVREKAQKEIEIYRNILNDLREDSVHFQRLHYLSQIHQRVYYQIYFESEGERTFNDNIPYDFIAITKTFTTLTTNNHENSIEELSSDEIRISLNKYFILQDRTRDGAYEFNQTVIGRSRNYIEENGILLLPNVFDENRNNMPEGRILDYEMLKRAMQDQKFLSTLASMRIAMGYFLSQLEALIQLNDSLIKNLESKLAE